MKNGVKTVQKPWGREIWYAHSPEYVGKIIIINKGHRLSRQYHAVKHETVYALKGDYFLELDGKKKIQRQGSAVVIAPKSVHRFEARYGRVTLLEVSTGAVKDIIRLEDDYGRT